MSKQAYISNKVFYPLEELDIEAVKDRYSIKQYDDMACQSCENRPFRHNDICDMCPRSAYKGETRLYTSRYIHDLPYVGLPIGDKQFYRNLGISNYRDFDYIDKRTLAPFKYPIEFTGTLYPNQLVVVNEFLSKKYGLIKAPPRTGKGPMIVYISVQLGQKTLILANQIEFLTQIEGHVRSMTNIEELERKSGRKLCGFPKNLHDFDHFMFLFSTYQRFLSDKGQELLISKVRDSFGTVMVDEVHTAAALRFSQVLGSLKPKYLLGCTATVERKDNRHVIIERLIGPITAESKKESLPVKMDLIVTEVKHKRNYTNFVYAMRFLSNDVKRNKLIVDVAIDQLKQGQSIVIPVQFKNHVFQLVKDINDRWGSEIAEIFVGGGGDKNKRDRNATLDRCRIGKTRVVVGIRRLLQLGVDVPRWTRIFEVIPISNKPNFLQETSRIRTPCAEIPHKEPRIIFFVDCEIGPSLGCFRSTVGHLRSPEFNQYSWSDSAKKILSGVLKGNGSYYGKDNEDDIYKPVRTLFEVDNSVTDKRTNRRL
jgi:superfamily II DNA or RNA helicase